MEPAPVTAPAVISFRTERRISCAARNAWQPRLRRGKATHGAQAPPGASVRRRLFKIPCLLFPTSCLRLSTSYRLPLCARPMLLNPLPSPSRLSSPHQSGSSPTSGSSPPLSPPLPSPRPRSSRPVARRSATRTARSFGVWCARSRACHPAGHFHTGG